jgi:P4 family phage/plasmid primase-like protien
MATSVYTQGDLGRFLKKFKTIKRSNFTHTSIIKPSGSFYIPKDQEATFFALYKASMKSGEDLHLTEKHADISPILIDLDLRFPVPSAPVDLSHRYTQDDIEAVLRAYIAALSEQLDFSKATMYVMEKPSGSVDKNVIKDGLHVVVPDIVTRAAVQYRVRERVMEELRDMFLSMGATNAIEDIIDERVIEHNVWQMYGSKKPGGNAYKIVFVYTWENGKMAVSRPDMPHEAYVELLAIRNKYKETPILAERVEELEAFENAMYADREKKKCVMAATQKNKQGTKNEYPYLGLVETLVRMLAPQRATAYDSWIRVGWMLRNIDYKLLPLWIEFSRQSPKFAEGECDRHWDYMREDGLGIGTLHMWAKVDNPTAYQDAVSNDLSELIKVSLSKSHYDIAKVVHHMFQHQYVCVSIKQRQWYEFKEHRWHACDGGYTLRNRISSEVYNEFIKLSTWYNNQALMAAPSDQATFTGRSQICNAIALKLKDTGFKSDVMKECGDMFYMPRFEDKLDSRTNLIGFKDGVLDLDTMEFREGHPEDWISFSTHTVYREYCESDPQNQEIMTFLSAIMPKEDMRDYVLKVMASCLDGVIREERFHIWTGNGCHAIDTPIMMADGRPKMIQDIVVGDQLMGDDSAPRNVERLWRGESDMYEIQCAKGETFTVNGRHKLVIRITNGQKPRITGANGKNPAVNWLEKVSWSDEDGFDIKVRRKGFKELADAEELLAKLVADKQVCQFNEELEVMVCNILARKLKDMSMFKKGMELPARDIPLDAYLVGYWLGDGTTDYPSITTESQEVIDYFKAALQDEVDWSVYDDRGAAKTWGSRAAKGCKTNVFRTCLQDLNLFGKKHIPDVYKYNSREVRMQLLAGLMDSDGHYQISGGGQHYEITQKNKVLADDIVWLARSLGFTASMKQVSKRCCNNNVWGTYYRMNIYGYGMEDIPVKVPYKKTKPYVSTRDPHCQTFKIQRVDDGKFYGVQVDRNHRYLLANFTVSANSNGKSKLLELLMNALGDYYCNMNVTAITGKRVSSNSTNSELVRAKGKRALVMQEPGDDEKMNVGWMKELTGGDRLIARGLFKEPVEFKPQFKMILTCNHLPQVPAEDGGTWRRIRLVEFTSRFVENPDPSNPNEFIMDKELSGKFDSWRETFTGLLIEYYRRYRDEGTHEPDDVMECTRQYQRSNDAMGEYTDERMEKDDAGFIQVGDIYTDCRDWIRECNPGVKAPRRKEVQAYFEKVWGKLIRVGSRTGWKGWRLKATSQVMANDDDPDDF